MGEISPGKVQNLSPRAAWLYPMRLDEVWALLFPASSPPAHWPHCQFVYLRSKVCSPLLSASPRGYALRFATVTIISSGWLLSSNKILPMLGTLGQTIGFRRLPCHGQTAKMTVCTIDICAGVCGRCLRLIFAGCLRPVFRAKPRCATKRR